jgi:FlaA1/EpsC-like NDP-sugar epimerase
MRTLITGGTGTIGRALAKLIPDATIVSRDESMQVKMRQEFPDCKYIIADVRDVNRMIEVIKGYDYVYHLAAMKHIEICEQQPQEAIKTNVLGTMNVINACRLTGAKMINMSTDKAVNPASVYGRTKALSEAMVTEAFYLSVRSGNVLWSSGSVLERWTNQLRAKNMIELTHVDMTRFFVHPNELASFLVNSRTYFGIVTIPMRSFRLHDMAMEFIKIYGDKDSKIQITGLRDGERLHEYRDENTSSAECLNSDLSYIFGHANV